MYTKIHRSKGLYIKDGYFIKFLFTSGVNGRKLLQGKRSKLSDDNKQNSKRENYKYPKRLRSDVFTCSRTIMIEI